MKDLTPIANWLKRQRGLTERALSPTQIKKYLDIAAANMEMAKKEIMPFDRQLGKEVFESNKRLWDSMQNLMNQRRGIKEEDSLDEAVSRSPVEFWITYHYGDGPKGKDVGPTPMKLYTGQGAESRAKSDAKKLDYGYEKIQVSLPRRKK